MNLSKFINKYSIELMLWIDMLVKKFLPFYLGNMSVIIALFVLKISSANTLWFIGVVYFLVINIFTYVDLYLNNKKTNSMIDYFKKLLNYLIKGDFSQKLVFLIWSVILLGIIIFLKGNLLGNFTILYFITSLIIVSSTIEFIVAEVKNPSKRVGDTIDKFIDSLIVVYSNPKITIANIIGILILFGIFYFIAPVMLVIVLPIFLELLISIKMEAI